MRCWRRRWWRGRHSLQRVTAIQTKTRTVAIDGVAGGAISHEHSLLCKMKTALASERLRAWQDRWVRTVLR